MGKKTALAALIILLTAGVATAAWPEKPIRIVVPWPGANDPSTIILNAMAPHLKKELGVPVKVVNHAGGSGVLGAHKVATARPDGHTLGMISIGPMITQVIRGKTPYKNQDFEPLGLVWSSPFTLSCRGDAPYNNLKELSEYAKQHPLKLAHWGLGAVPTLIAMRIAEVGGFEWKETAYKNLNPLLVVKKDADVITYSITALRDYIESGQIKILACMLPDRLPAYPDVPTVEEQGFGEGYSIWFGLFAPKDTPGEIVDRMSKVFFEVMDHPEVKTAIENVGSVPHPIGPAEARKRMDRELKDFEGLMKNLGIIQ